LGVPRNVGSVAWGEARTRGFATPAFAGCALLKLADPRYAVVRRTSRTVRGRGFKAEQVGSIASSSYRQPWTPSPWLGRRFSSCMPSWNRWQSPPPAVLAATWLSWLASCECHGEVLGRQASRRSGSGQRSGGVGHAHSPQPQRDPRGVRRTERVLLPGDLCRRPHDDGGRRPTAGDFTDWN